MCVDLPEFWHPANPKKYDLCQFPLLFEQMLSLWSIDESCEQICWFSISFVVWCFQFLQVWRALCVQLVEWNIIWIWAFVLGALCGGGMHGLCGWHSIWFVVDKLCVVEKSGFGGEEKTVDGICAKSECERDVLKMNKKFWKIYFNKVESGIDNLLKFVLKS